MVEIYCDTCGEKFVAVSGEELARVMRIHKSMCTPVHPSPSEGEGWEERTPAFMSFDEAGMEITGILEALDTIQLHDKEIRRARVRTSDGVKSFLLTTQLEPLILDLPVGTSLRVKYEGETLTAAKRRIKSFRVWVKKPA